MTSDRWWEDPECEFAKVTYLTMDRYETQAYIDLRTGRGDNKHTDQPVRVQWSDTLNMWIEVPLD